MKVSRQTRVALCASAAGLLIVGAAVAETAGAGLPAAVQRLLDCRSQSPDAARLACYDAAVGDLARLIGAGEIVVVDKERVATVKRQAFGFSLPSLNLFDRGDKPAELESLSAVAVSARQGADRKWIVELEDGAVWAQTDDERIRRDPHKGSKVVISKGVLGSFFMEIDGQWAVRARRVK